MFRYCIKLYSGRIFKTMSNTESQLPRERKYIQVLGFINRWENGYSFHELSLLPTLDVLRGTQLTVVDTRGMVKRMSSRVKEVWKEKL